MGYGFLQSVINYVSSRTRAAGTQLGLSFGHLEAKDREVFLENLFHELVSACRFFARLLISFTHDYVKECGQFCTGDWIAPAQ